MINRYKKFFIILLLCSVSIANAKLNTIVSVVPQKVFVEKIGGNKVSVTLMVKPGSSPHSYEPKPSQMKDIAKADIYFSIGVEFEKVWLTRFTNQNHNMKVIDLGYGVIKKNKDPHIWTSPKNVKIIANNIYNSLVKNDLKNKTYYKNNYDKFLKELDELDLAIKTILKDTPKDSKFMVFHPAWGYFARDYHLIQLPIEVDGKNPKPRDIVKLIIKAKQAKVKAILTAPEFSIKVATQIAKELNIKVVPISPLAKKWNDNMIFLAHVVSGNL